jgi:hypothetical protein
MRFFCYHRDRPGFAALRDTVLEEHRPCMDRYAAETIARDPTSTATRPPAACTSSTCRISAAGQARDDPGPPGGDRVGVDAQIGR